MSVRIVDVREVTKPISSPIRNAYIDFTKMTTSLVAVVTDVVRDGKRVVGYGFNSNGRYGQGGLIRERFAPRLLEADPKTLLDQAGSNLDPDKVWATLMSNEKPGGHGERSVAVGTIDMAVWDAVAKIAGKPLFRLLAERHGRKADPRVFVYAAGGYYYPGKDLSALRGEMRGYLDRGYNVVKMKIGGAPIAEDRERIEAVLKEIGKDAQLAVDANGRFDLETAIAYAKMLREYPLFWYEEAGDPLDFAAAGGTRGILPGADGDRRKPVQPPGCAQPDPLRRHAAGPRLAAIRLRAVLWALRISAHARRAAARTAGRRAAAFRMAATRCRSTSRRASASAAMRAIPICSSPMAASPTACASRTAISHAGPARHRVRGEIGSLCGDEGAGGVSFGPINVIARSQRVRPSAGPMINSATKQSTLRLAELWIASRSLSSGGALRRPGGSQ